MNTEDDNEKKICIIGVTPSGESFRPSNWAERMSEKLSTFAKHRLHYSPLLQPGTRNGNKCILLDPALKKSNPKLYQSILDFAETNQLQICKESKDETSPKTDQQQAPRDEEGEEKAENQDK